jgi:chemotaxis protein methyltransferase CheR
MDLSALECQRLRQIVHELCGLSLGEEKAYLLQHRLAPVARAAGCGNFTDFLAKLAGPDGLSLRDPVIEAITTKETSFFRDRHPFETFSKRVLPELAEQVRRRRASNQRSPARIWCTAVSTGQEAYSLAMLIDDYRTTVRGRDLEASDFSILATDISADSLAFARKGVYSQQAIRDVADAFRDRYFGRTKDGWAIREELARRIEYRKLNLTDVPLSVGMMDLIFCRNVLIYFDDATRRRVCEHLADSLVPGGYLLLGTVENLYTISSRFTSEHIGPTLLYRRI